MPNWTTNRLQMSFKNESDKNAFLEKHIINGEFDFNTVIPEPTSPEGLEDKYIWNEKSHIERLANKPWFNWYEWRIHFWNSDRNTSSNTVIEFNDEKEFSICFSTPWIPVLRIFREILNQYFDKCISFSYEWADENDWEFDCNNFPYSMSLSKNGKFTVKGC